MTIFGIRLLSLEFIFAIVAIGTLISWFAHLSNRAAKSLRYRQVRGGIYFCSWLDPVKSELHISTVRLKKHFGKVRISVLYAHSERHQFKMVLMPRRSNKAIYSGWWSAKGSSELYRGPALFNFHSDTFQGRWLGPKRDLTINSGQFQLVYLEDKENSYLQYKTNWLKRIPILLTKEHGDQLTRITEKLREKNKIGPRTVYGLELTIPEGAFDPALGKASIALVDHAANMDKKINNILDIGSGVGLNSIALAKKHNARTVGVEISASLINCAQANARMNDVQNCSFISASRDNPFKNLTANDKFDLIVSDFPFTRRELAYKSKKSVYHDRLCGSRALVERLILGSAYHIQPDGKLLFSYGSSGHKKFLDDLIEISPWEVIHQRELKEDDETFYIYELSLGKDIIAFADLAKNKIT